MCTFNYILLGFSFYVPLVSDLQDETRFSVTEVRDIGRGKKR